MSEDFDINEIMRLLQIQKGDQNIEQSIEQVLMNLIMNPLRMSTTQTQLVDIQNNGLISETKEGSFLNKAGFIEDIKQDSIFMLDDGTSMSGVAKCQTCNGIVKEENLKRCGCGKTCCVIPRCGKYLESKDKWYCSSLHAFLGFLGINLR